jgi:hypothetical protein
VTRGRDDHHIYDESNLLANAPRLLRAKVTSTNDVPWSEGLRHDQMSCCTLRWPSKNRGATAVPEAFPADGGFFRARDRPISAVRPPYESPSGCFRRGVRGRPVVTQGMRAVWRLLYRLSWLTLVSGCVT